MHRYIGEGPREMYWQRPDGKWTHAQAGGKFWDSMQDAEKHYQSLHKDQWIYQLLGFVIVLGLARLLEWLCE